MIGVDTAALTINKAHLLLGDGVLAVGKYLRPDRTTLQEIVNLHSVGIKIFSIGEKGNPTSKSYFTKAQATIDADRDVAFAKSIKQPTGTTLSPTIDYDSNPEDVKDYVITYHDRVKLSGYHVLLYGNGATLQWAVSAGYAVGGFLAQSTGFEGYAEFVKSPDCWIIQGQSETILGMNADADNIINKQCLW